MNRPQTDIEKAIEFLANDQRFQLVLGHIVSMRETAIGALATYKTTDELAKAAAEVTVWSDVLDLFGVPMGSPMASPE